MTSSSRFSSPATLIPGEQPAKPPLLLALHGWLLSSRLWQPLATALLPEWNLQALDLPGFGLRPRPVGLPPNLASYGRWLADHCLEQLPADRHVVLVGHSLGGSVALHAAAALGPRLTGLVQIAVGGGVYQPRPFLRVRRGGAAFVRWRPRWLSAVPGTAAIRAPLLADNRAAMGLLASSMRRTAVQQLPRLTANLQVPSLWIAGSRDSIMPPGYVRHLAGYAPRHEIAVLAGAGHLPMGDRPDRLAEVMRPWLADLLRHADQSAASPRSCRSANLA
jgi:2-succinyl-6-hydroxy-2,4-cyclohexadiene-1-carboxylate synthase